MLTILGKGTRGFCDGISRRNFIRIGGMALGGISLPQILRAEAASESGRSHKAVINVFLPGGPPHQDMWDLKPDAPSEIRGEFSPIRTNVSGIEIGELFPKMARMMDKFIPIRSIVGARGPHYAEQCMSGYPGRNETPTGGRPTMGAWVSKTEGNAKPGIPANLSLFYPTDHKPWGLPGGGGFLGMAHAPFQLVGGKQQKSSSAVDNMSLRGISLERLQDRRNLLAAFDQFRSEADASGSMDGLDEFTQQAIGILTSSKLAEALDLSKEDPKLRERYGQNDKKFRADGAPKMTENFLIARRLVEAGARVVALNFSRWDWHGNNFKRSREDMPMLDDALSALVTDLHDRGLDKDVSVVCWGEFGRTPKINSSAGRDHWPRVSCAMLACGGMRTGQVIGSTDRLGEAAKDRPVTFPEVFATLYHNMGIDFRTTREFDLSGRPQYLVPEGTEPIHEVI